MAQPSKSILIFCDGTGMDGILGLEDAPAGSLDKPVSNVLRLSRTVGQYRAAQGGAPRIPQIVLYVTGVGTQSGFDPNSKTTQMMLNGELGEQFNQGLGLFVASKIREVYTFIAQNYVAGDLICLFGFSRGAYTARKVAGLIDRVGILSGKDLYTFSEKLLDSKYRTPHPEVKVKCVGVWDTVGSVRTVAGEVVDAFSISDTALPSNVEHAYHALSLQENRSRFPPTLWSPINPPNLKGQVLEQVWFLGDHSDVGGGHQNVDLSDITLIWMADKIRQFVDLDNNKLQYYCNRTRTAGWGESQPNNAYLSVSRPLRTALFTTERRDSFWNARKDVLVHQSCDKAADPICRGYEIPRPKDLPEFNTRTRACFDPGGLEVQLRNSPKWQKSNLDPKRVKQPDTSQDATAIEWDKTRKAGRQVLDGKILTGGVNVVGGLAGTGAQLAGEIGRGVFGKLF